MRCQIFIDLNLLDNISSYHSGRSKDEDDVASLAAVDSPVLRPLQASNADMTPLQGPHIRAVLMEI